MSKLSEAKEVILEKVQVIEGLITECTDEEGEKRVADAILDMVEIMAGSMDPAIVGKVLVFVAGRFRAKYDIPEFGS